MSVRTSADWFSFMNQPADKTELRVVRSDPDPSPLNEREAAPAVVVKAVPVEKALQTQHRLEGECAAEVRLEPPV